MKSDLAIAREAVMAPIAEIAAAAGFLENELEPYGKYKAKLAEAALARRADRPDGKLILVTAVNPTPAGEGKTTTAIGLADALASTGRKTMLALRGCAGLELVRAPFHCAMSVHHRLATKDRLQLSDLHGENLLMMHRGWSHYVDQLRDDLWQHHPQIHIIDFKIYSMDMFNRCESTNDVLLAIPGWANVHPLLKVIPVEWDYSIPFGVMHSPDPSPVVRRFLDVAKAVRGELYG